MWALRPTRHGSSVSGHGLLPVILFVSECDLIDPAINFGVYWLMRTVPRVLVLISTTIDSDRQLSQVPIKGVTYIRGHKDLQDDNQLPIMMFSTGTVACKVFLAEC